jgi:hypothetical protein
MQFLASGRVETDHAVARDPDTGSAARDRLPSARCGSDTKRQREQGQHGEPADPALNQSREGHGVSV